MSDALLTARPVLRIGRKRTEHTIRVKIEEGQVVIRTGCGLDPLPEGFTETWGLPTCDACVNEAGADAAQADD